MEGSKSVAGIATVSTGAQSNPATLHRGSLAAPTHALLRGLGFTEGLVRSDNAPLSSGGGHPVSPMGQEDSVWGGRPCPQSPEASGGKGRASPPTPLLDSLPPFDSSDPLFSFYGTSVS